MADEQTIEGVKISGLNNASTLTGTELVPVVQGGKTLKTTVEKIREGSNKDVSFLDLTDVAIESYTGLDGEKIIIDEAAKKLIAAPSTTSSGFYDIDNLSEPVYDDATKILTIPGTYKIVTANGRTFEKTNDEIKIVAPSTNVIISIYYDNDGNLQQESGLNRYDIYTKMLITVPVAYVLWSTTMGAKVFVGDYRKGRTSNRLWVKNFFDVQVTKLTGIDVFGVTYGDGDSDADARFGLSSGYIIFTDRSYVSPTRAETNTWNIGYYLGNEAVGSLNKSFPVLTDIDVNVGSTGRIVYNNNGAPTAVSNNDYVWYFMAISNSLIGENRTSMFMGNSEYGNANQARNGLDDEIDMIESTIPVRQGYTLDKAVLFRTENGATNAVKGYIVEVRNIVSSSNGGGAITPIPDELINGGDASSLHNHDSLYGNVNTPLSWNKVAGLTDTDPLTGNVAFNNAVLADVTEVYVSNITVQSMSIGATLSNSAGNGLIFQQKSDESKYIVFLVDSVVDNGTYHTFNIIEYDSSTANFDDNEELATTYTAAVSSGGGHIIRDKDNNDYAQKPVLKYQGKVEDGTGETILIPRFDNNEDVNISGAQEGDAFTMQSDFVSPQSTQVDEKILPEISEPNIGDGFQDNTQEPISTVWLQGRTCSAWLINDTANDITGVVITDGVNDLHTPVTLLAGGHAYVTFNMAYASPDTDTPLFAYATTWNSGTLTLRHTQIQN